jgi:ribose transport system permease protein
VKTGTLLCQHRHAVYCMWYPRGLATDGYPQSRTETATVEVLAPPDAPAALRRSTLGDHVRRRAAALWKPQDFMRRFGVILVWFATIAIFSILRPDTFFTFTTVQTLAGSQAVLLILALGLLIPLTAGEFDLSAAAVMGLSLVLIGWLNVIHGWPIGAAIAVALATGLFVGTINAFFVVVARVDSFIVTLGTGTVLGGVMLGVNTVSTGGISLGLVNAATRNVFGLPLAFYYGLALTLLVWYVMSQTPLGRYLFFVGSGREVARLSGLRVDRIRAGSFLVSGFVSALAGVVLAGWLGASDVSVSPPYMLSSFAAAFLGTSILQPGRFNAWGTFIAVYFLVTGITGLELLGLAGWIESVFYGSSLVLAVALSRTITLPRRAAKRG